MLPRPPTTEAPTALQALRWSRTVVSVLVAVAASTLALDLAGGATMGAPRLASGALLSGGATAAVHYLGMSAIRGR